MKKVLVAEDEESIREFIVINLTRSGYEVEQAENGAVALEKFSKDQNGFDVVILYIMMPEIDGLTVCKELRKRSADLGIIMLSAKTQEMDKVTGLLFGADDYVTKPFSPSELMARVDAVYRRVEMTRGFRQNDTTGDSIVLDEFELNLRNRTLSKNGEPIELTQVVAQFILNDGHSGSQVEVDGVAAVVFLKSDGRLGIFCTDGVDNVHLPPDFLDQLGPGVELELVEEVEALANLGILVVAAEDLVHHSL